MTTRNITASHFIEDWAAEHNGNTPPYEWVICDVCRGNGTSSAHLGAFTEHDMHELGDDFRDDYMAGSYDRPCDECGGTGKVRNFVGVAAEAWAGHLRSIYEMNAMYAAERRMGA